LIYKLTGAELVIFGCAESTAEQKVAITKVKEKTERESSVAAFMWKIFSRLKVKLKVHVYMLIPFMISIKIDVGLEE
jgi:hypothetical protein